MPVPEHVLIGTILTSLTYVFGYGVFRWRLMKTTHDYRTRVGCEAVRWSTDLRVSEEARDLLLKMANSMYRPMIPWVIAIALVIAVFLAFKPFNRVPLSEDAEVDEQLLRLQPRLVLAMVTTSPLACALGLSAFVIGLLLHSSVAVVMDIISTASRASFQLPYGFGRIIAPR